MSRSSGTPSPFGSAETRAGMLATLPRLASATVAVVGDLVLDRFVVGTSTRISREAPVLILRHQQTTEVLGGGANTIANVRALGANVLALGAIGDDDNGRTIARLLDEAGVDTAHRRLHEVPGWPTTTKTRILGGLTHSTMQQIVRVDHEEPLPDSHSGSAEDPGPLTTALIAELEEIWPTLDGVIVSDYGLGVVQPALVDALRSLNDTRRIPVNVDSRYALPLFTGLTAMTPNISEVEATLDDDRLSHDLPRLERRAACLRDDLDLDALLVTRGKFGMALFERDQDHPVLIPVFGGDEVADVTGAGDTVIATYTSALAAGASHEIAARLANVAGGQVVMKRGTAIVPIDELEAAIRD